MDLRPAQNVRFLVAISTGQRNTCVKSICRRFERQRCISAATCGDSRYRMYRIAVGLINSGELLKEPKALLTFGDHEQTQFASSPLSLAMPCMGIALNRSSEIQVFAAILLLCRLQARTSRKPGMIDPREEQVRGCLYNRIPP